ncbi:hypothetical protein [Gloeocapsa sp. PCC 73106]|uniref:hypothetical protein n=1 Tax=Gloeocapsa sp. PCC 73106 TaxID=102232 RepID=UPI0002ABB7D5|nr:hypothetical protein [Gloeocapsa sp. PCC 73106]ELR97540.1 hypothetical protein GLO73106DRAFT_00013500 [Gloeocapsa sp. PCC 73106]
MKPWRIIVAGLLLAIAIPNFLLAILEISGSHIAPGSQWLNLPVFLILALPSSAIALLLMRRPTQSL